MGTGSSPAAVPVESHQNITVLCSLAKKCSKKKKYIQLQIRANGFLTATLISFKKVQTVIYDINNAPILVFVNMLS